MSSEREEAQLAMQLLESGGLPVPYLGLFEMTPVAMPRVPEDALAELRSFGGQGWVCYTDCVLSVDDAASLPAGIPLSAELCKGSVSLHLRQVEGGWRVVRLGSTEGDQHLIFTARRPRLGGGTLVYEVAWERGAEAWRPWCSRLSAIEVGGD